VRIIKYLVYVSALVPLIIFSQYISPFHFGKVVVLRSIVELMLTGYLLLIWRDRSYLPKMNQIIWAFLLFTLAFTVTTITSVQPYQSFWGALERMGGLWTFWHYFIYFIIIISIIRTREDWFRLFKIMAVMGALSALYGFGQKTDIEFFIGSGNRSRIFGTIGNAALFAGYQLLILFLSLTMLLGAKLKRSEKWLYSLAACLTGIAVLMTAVRGSILALGVGCLLFAFLYWRVTFSALAKKALISLLILAAIFVSSSFAFKNSDFVKNSSYLTRITNLSLKNFTVKTRFWAWEAGIKGWNDSPKTILLGWGPENFNIPFSKNFNPNFFTGLGSETLFDRAHNMFVEILVTMGLIGLIAYIGLFIVTLRLLWKKIKEKSSDSVYASGLFTLIIVYMIHNSFIFDTSANFLTFFTILGSMSFLLFKTETITAITPKRINPGLFSFVAVILIILAAILIYQTNILPAKANYATTRAIVRGWNSDFNGAISKYKEALTYNVPGKYEIRNRFAQYVLERAIGSKITPEITEVIKLAIVEVQKNADENPLDYLPHLYLSRLNIVLGKDNPSSPFNDEALKHVLMALDISPTFVRTYYELGQVYLNKKNLVKAVEYFKQAAELNPNVGVSYWYWGMVEIELGNQEMGLELINKALDKNFNASESDYQKLIAVYLKINDYDHIIEIYKKLILLKPNNAQYHASLAVAYARIGKISEAVEQARMAAKLDPTFEPEAKRFVQELGRQW